MGQPKSAEIILSSFGTDMEIGSYSKQQQVLMVEALPILLEYRIDTEFVETFFNREPGSALDEQTPCRLEQELADEELPIFVEK